MTEHHPQAGRAQGIVVEQVDARSLAARSGLAWAEAQIRFFFSGSIT